MKIELKNLKLEMINMFMKVIKVLVKHHICLLIGFLKKNKKRIMLIKYFKKLFIVVIILNHILEIKLEKDLIKDQEKHQKVMDGNDYIIFININYSLICVV